MSLLYDLSLFALVLAALLVAVYAVMNWKREKAIADRWAAEALLRQQTIDDLRQQTVVPPVDDETVAKARQWDLLHEPDPEHTGDFLNSAPPGRMTKEGLAREVFDLRGRYAAQTRKYGVLTRRTAGVEASLAETRTALAASRELAIALTRENRELLERCGETEPPPTVCGGGGSGE